MLVTYRMQLINWKRSINTPPSGKIFGGGRSQSLKTTTMKFNFFHEGRAITKAQFINNVPSDWHSNLDEYGNYSWGLYKAISKD